MEHEWLKGGHMPLPEKIVESIEPLDATCDHLGLSSSILLKGQPVPVIKDTRPPNVD